MTNLTYFRKTVETGVVRAWYRRDALGRWGQSKLRETLHEIIKTHFYVMTVMCSFRSKAVFIKHQAENMNE